MNDINKIETLFKDKIKGFLNQNSFNTWIRPIRIISLDNETISFQVPSKVHIDYIKGQYRTVFENALKEITGRAEIITKFLIDSDTDYSIERKEEGDRAEKKLKPVAKSRLAPYKETSLNPKYTFENFVMGNGNETAYVSSMQVAQNVKNTQYNPLLIFGGVGPGKNPSGVGNRQLCVQPRSVDQGAVSDFRPVRYTDRK
jgi:chromosomal replication initiator protein